MKRTRTYEEKSYLYGTIWILTALVVMLCIPLCICSYLNVWPKFTYILKGLAPVAILFYPTAVIEVITYTPMLGANGTYLSFVTGNITNLKLPCAMSAMDSAKVTANSKEGDVVSTIAIATSSIVTTLIIALGVLIFRPILPYLTEPSSPFSPAFQQVVPALFGALGATYFAKHWKIAIAPIAVVLIALAVSGSLSVGVLIPISVVVSLLCTHLLYKKGWL